MVRLAHRGKAYPAIAEHGGSYTVPRRWRQDRIPRRLPVIVGMHIDPPGCYQGAVRIDLPMSGADVSAGDRDAPAVDREVSRVSRTARAIDDGAITNDCVMHAKNPPPIYDAL